MMRILLMCGLGGLVCGSALAAQAVPASPIPSGTYTFLWGGVDTTAARLARSGALPATLPAIGRLAGGTLEIMPGPQRRFVLTWTVRPIGAPDTTKRATGKLGGTVGMMQLVTETPAGAPSGYVYRNATTGVYYLLPGHNVRIALSLPH